MLFASRIKVIITKCLFGKFSDAKSLRILMKSLAVNLLSTLLLPRILSRKYCINTFIAFVLMTVFSFPSFSESFTAKRAGQGFTGLTQDHSSSLSNPALMSKYNADSGLYFSLNLTLLSSDEFDVIDTAEDIANDLEALANEINNGLVKDQPDDLNQQVDHIIDNLQMVDQKVVNLRSGLNFQMIIPNEYLTFGLFTNQYSRVGGLVDYDESDEQVLKNAINNEYLDLDDLNSTTTGIGYSIAEFGIMSAYKLVDSANYQLSLGAKLKHQRVDLFFSQEKITNFEDDDFDLSNDDDLTSKSKANVDLGLYFALGENEQWRFALVGNNLFSQQLQHPEQDLTFTLKPSSMLAVSYNNDWLTLATDIDLTEREFFVNLEPSQYMSLGAEFRFYQAVHFRAGFRSDLNDIDSDIYTLGIGIMPWDIVSIDFAIFAGANDNTGGALQLALTI